MNISTHHFPFMQAHADKPDFVEKTCAMLARIPVEWHELVIDPLFEDSGRFREAAFAELEAWREGLRSIGKKTGSCYFNFPAVQIDFDGEAQASLTRFLGALKASFPEMETLVSNPVPLDWTNPSILKSEQQLEEQLGKFKTLSRLVREAGLTFAYHFHSPELHADCREFDFMLGNMTPEELSLALDTNWCVMADVDPLEITRRHLGRIRLVHLRSSHDKIWDETLEDGEEGNRAIVRTLVRGGYDGPWVIELAENGGSRSLSLDERF
ncbi:MAG: sugar phosphate isomerase/epimerase family protein, partial [Puniceicoccaceae bacterium]